MTANFQEETVWLPDLCNPLALLRLVLLAVLVSVVLTLLRKGVSGFNVESTGLLFFYSVWVVFIASAGLCFLRRWATGLSVPISVSLALCWLLVAASLCAGLAFLAWEQVLVSDGVALFQLWIETVLITLILGALVLRFLYVHYELQRQQRRLMQAQFDALQARIRPHFLFNSLNSIATLVGMDSNRAEDALLNLSDILRASLGEKTAVTLEEELDLCSKYLEIEKLRMGDRLQVIMDIEAEVKSQVVPSLCLQPLIENSVLHGLQRLPFGGELRVRIWPGEKTGMHIRIENPVTEENISSTGSNSALNNIKARLQQFYEDEVDFQANLENGQFIVSIDIRKNHV